MKKLLAVAMLAITVAAGWPAAASSIIIPPRGDQIGNWGPSSGQTYGQVFVAPDAMLLDYTLWVSGSEAFPFVSQVYAWDGDGVTGAALYTSAIHSVTSTLTAFTFAPNIMLTQGASYVATVTNRPFNVGLGGSGSGTMARGTASTGFTFTGGDPTASSSWCTSGCALSAQFTANFAPVGGGPVPEPAAWALMILGFGAAGAAVRSRKHRYKLVERYSDGRVQVEEFIAPSDAVAVERAMSVAETGALEVWRGRTQLA
jgi:hypothetical protein